MVRRYRNEWSLEVVTMEQTTQHYMFLDTLHKDGMTDMTRSVPFLADRFDLEEIEAKEILDNWFRREGNINLSSEASYV